MKMKNIVILIVFIMSLYLSANKEYNQSHNQHSLRKRVNVTFTRLIILIGIKATDKSHPSGP